MSTHPGTATSGLTTSALSTSEAPTSEATTSELTTGELTTGEATTGEATRVAPDRGWRRAGTTAITVWGAAALGYVLINGMAWMTRQETGPRWDDMLTVWNRWDTGHYVTIATSGYNPTTENPAFFPLYSLVMRVLEPVLPGGMLSAGLIISNVSCVVALIFLYQLVRELGGEQLASRTVFALMAYPFAFFLCAAYNEAFFLMLTVASLYFMRRSQWWLAGGLGGLASATRQAGVLLIVAFVVEYLRQQPRPWTPRAVRPDALAVALVPTGVIGYALYCWHAFGDPLKFVSVQAAWGREPTLPFLGTWRALVTIVREAQDGFVFQPLIVLNAIDVLAALATLALLILSVVGPWRLGGESLFLIVFAATSFLVVLISPIGLGVPLHGVPRYALEIVPAFMVLARMGANPTLERLYLIPALLTQGVLVLSFYHDIWVA